MNFRLVWACIGLCVSLTCPAMDRISQLDDDYDYNLALAMSLSQQEFEAQKVPQAIKQAPKPQAAVSKQSQQEIDADYAYALSIEEGQQVILRAMHSGIFPVQRPLDPAEQRRREYATKIALEKHLMGALVDYGHTAPGFMPDGSVKLPLSIAKLPVLVSQLTVIKQREPGTCGSRSVANAAALCDLVRHGMSLNSANIQKMAQKYEHIHTKNGLSTKDEIELARSLDLHNTYAIALCQIDPIGKKEINRYPFTVIESTELEMVNLYRESEILEDIVRAIRMEKTIVANFLCHIDGDTGHGVVVSIVKQEGQPTRMIYMDSNNMPIADHSQAAAYICYLYWQFVA